MERASIGELFVTGGNLKEQKADLLVLPVAKEDRALSREAAALLGGEGTPVAAALSSGDFQGEPGETALVYGTGPAFGRVLLLGTGPAKDLTRERVRSLGATAGRKARDLGVGRALLALPLPGSSFSPAEEVELCGEGALLGTYRFTEYKTGDREKIKSAGSFGFLLPSAPDGPVREALRKAEIRAAGVNFARDLANLPGNVLTPTELAARAQAVAREENLKATVFDRAACEKLGMGAFLSVARGSDQPPQFIVLEYDCGKAGAPLIALVGKGLTFDAGGISLKPAAKMDEMKFDMCGAAAVLGAMKSVRKLGIPVNVVAAVPATENLPGGRATKPGDIVKSYIGKTIEVLNTDAEGRLILADALGYVVRNYKPAAVVDLATLTGAVVIALGHYGAAVLSNDDPLARRVEAAADTSGDRCWRLPLWEEYPEHMKGETADLKNIADGSAGGGTIAGGIFLREFVEETPWAHIDIAGTAYWEKDRPHLPKGPSGYGVRLLLDLLAGYGR